MIWIRISWYFQYVGSTLMYVAWFLSHPKPCWKIDENRMRGLVSREGLLFGEPWMIHVDFAWKSME